MYHIDIELAQACRTYFILATSAAVGLNTFPALRATFLLYGARSQPTSSGSSSSSSSSSSFSSNITTNTTQESRQRQSQDRSGGFDAFLVAASKLQVPHSWFTHFYVLSVASSLFWSVQILMRGRVFGFLVAHFRWRRGGLGLSNGKGMGSMTVNQVGLTWLSFMVHGSRRLYESVRLRRESKATMSLVAYAVAGLAFYAVMGVSVWVEGIPALVGPGLSLQSLDWSWPSLKTFVAVPLFVIASVVQHECHLYLASLTKYTLPNRQLFRYVLCPHYTAECVIYLALSIMAAPQGSFLNRTLFSALVFSIANLGVTADSTMEWYGRKFGIKKIQGRWRMLPFVY